MEVEAKSLAIEVTVISGEELFLSKTRRVRRNAFVVVETDTSTSQRTKEDKEGGSNPTWNQKLNMNLPNNARHITVEVHCRTSSGDKVVGFAIVQTSDFVGGYAPHGYLHFLSYRLKDLNGEKNGIINLAVRLLMGRNNTGNSDYGINYSKSRTDVGIPMDDSKNSLASGMVTGFPIGYNSCRS